MNWKTFELVCRSILFSICFLGFCFLAFLMYDSIRYGEGRIVEAERKECAVERDYYARTGAMPPYENYEHCKWYGVDLIVSGKN